MSTNTNDASEVFERYAEGITEPEERERFARYMEARTMTEASPVTGLSVYVSGPMSGIEGWNKEALDAVRDELYRGDAQNVYDPADYIEVLEKLSHQEQMRWSIHHLTKPCTNGAYYDLMVLLPGWQGSEGCKLERTVAEACGIEVWDLSDVVA